MPVSAFSIPQAKRGVMPKTNEVGPGQYQPKKQNRVEPPSHAFPKNKRGVEDKRDVPGPGNYESIGKVSKAAPEYSIARKYKERPPDPVPGPEEYSPKFVEKKIAPSYTMRQKTSLEKPNNNPGPGGYDPSVEFTKEGAPGVRIGRDKKCKDWDTRTNPGPGTYDQEDNTKTKPPTWVFGHEEKGDLMENKKTYRQTPGPGVYEKPSIFEENVEKRRGNSMVPRRSADPAQNLVGPGQYEQNVSPLRNQAPLYSIGKQKRDKPNKELIDKPGPGVYDPNLGQVKRRDPEYGFGTDKRKPLNDDLRTPGPGTYENDRRIGEGPEYGMRLKNSMEKPNMNPGPGGYDPNIDAYSVKRTVTAMGIGTAKRDEIYHVGINPGPGAYEQNQDPIKTAAPNRRFGTDNKLKVKPTTALETPGPGNYEAEGTFEYNTRKGKGNSMVPKRQRPSSAGAVPGPGAYNEHKQFTNPNAPNYSIGNDARVKQDKERVLVPGPGAYQPVITQSKLQEPNYSFGKANRSDLYDNKGNPGPGSYNYQKEISENPRFALGIKLNPKGKDNVPGPSDYHPTIDTYSIKRSQPAIGFGSEKKGLVRIDENPGPGTYEGDQSSIKTSAPQRRFGTAPRTRPQSALVPGPGAYEFNSEFDAGLLKNKGTSLVPKRSKRDKREVPGPGAYQPDLSQSKTRPASCKIGKSKRMRDNGHDKVVGPGTYDPNLSHKRKGPGWGFGTDAKLTKLYQCEDTPGAGTYEHGTSIGKGKAYGMRIKTDQSKANQNPGPGTYQPTIDSYSIKRTAPSIGIGTSKRREINEVGVNPGPGAYKHQKYHKEKPPQFSFGTATRGDQSKREVPGPGNYEAHNLFDLNKSKGKGTTMISRRPQSAKETMSKPGPGAYQEDISQVRPSSSKYGIGTESRFKSNGAEKMRQSTPGPGAYNQEDRLRGRALPNTRFTKGKRDSLRNKNEFPGPGTYDSAGFKKGKKTPAYIIGMKTKNEFPKEVPGPGQYDPNHSQVKVSHTNVGFTKSVRYSKRPSSANPGPGQYDTRGKLQGPEYRFGSSLRDRKRNKEVPGPGTYEIKPMFADVPKYLLNGPLKIHL